MKNQEQEKKPKLKERLKDKRERAKIELIFYLVFFTTLVIIARIGTSKSSNNISSPIETPSFINTITDNYEYIVTIELKDTTHTYQGRVLGHNGTITKDNEEYYYKKGDKYYILDTQGNYILTSKEKIYPYIAANYLDIEEIKQYLKEATKENNTYQIKVSNIILNTQSTDNISITINEEKQEIKIDYTNLFKIDNQENPEDKEIVTIKYSNIGTINSLEE